jgi:hypothetical protein
MPWSEAATGAALRRSAGKAWSLGTLCTCPQPRRFTWTRGMERRYEAFRDHRPVPSYTLWHHAAAFRPARHRE